MTLKPPPAGIHGPSSGTLSESVSEHARRAGDPFSRFEGLPANEQRTLAAIARGQGPGILRLIATTGIDLSALQTAVERYEVTGVTEKRTLDGGTATLADLVNVVGTLINDLSEALEDAP
jgi:hypothetical protein